MGGYYHQWKQVSHCLNGPHVWKCEVCGEWTRSYSQPDPAATLIDPDNGQQYTAAAIGCATYGPPSWPAYDPPDGDEREYAGLFVSWVCHRISIPTLARVLGKSHMWLSDCYYRLVTKSRKKAD